MTRAAASTTPPCTEAGHRASAVASFETRSYSFGERLQIAAADAALAVLGAGLRLGGAPLREALCAVLGFLGYLTFVDKRRIASVNLELVFGSQMDALARRRVIRAMFVHFVRLGLDFIFDSVYWPPEKLGERVRVVSRRGSVIAPLRIDDGMREGLVFMTFHFPDEVDTNALTIDATDRRSGTAEFKAAAVRDARAPADNSL